MSELRPTTKNDRMYIYNLYRDDSSIEAQKFLRLIADIDRRDAILRRLVECDEHERSSYGFLRRVNLIIADARKELDQ